MSQYRILRNSETEAIILPRARWCASLWCRFKGLMLIKGLPEDEGLLFVNSKDSRVDTAIHMLFMRFRIGVIWINSQGKVVDKRLAKPWRLAYVPKSPAQYFIEANPSVLERVEIGDHLRFDELSD